MLKKPIMANMPHKPSEPTEPEEMVYLPKHEYVKGINEIDVDYSYDDYGEVRYVDSVIITVDSLKKIQDVVELVSIKENIKNVKIDVYKGLVSYEELCQNPAYTIQYRSYEKALNKHKVKFAQYEAKFEVYKKDLESYKTLKLQYDYEQSKFNFEKLQKKMESI